MYIGRIVFLCKFDVTKQLTNTIIEKHLRQNTVLNDYRIFKSRKNVNNESIWTTFYSLVGGIN